MIKELSIEEKARRYDEAIERANNLHKDAVEMENKMTTKTCEIIFPELKESEDEQHRKWILEYLYDGLRKSDKQFKDQFKSAIAWLEKQETVEEIVSRCKTSWYNEGKIQGQIEGLSDEEKYQQGWHDALEKQGVQKSKNISLWKHWKNGIAGNGEGKPIYLVKVGNTYSITSCLVFECDYIELSELDDLMLEKLGVQKPTDNQFTTEQASLLDKHIDKLIEQAPADKYEWSGKIKSRKAKGVLKEMLDEKLKSI